MGPIVSWKVGNDFLKDGTDSCPERSVRTYHYTLRNNPEERWSHLHHAGSLKSCEGARCLSCLNVTHVLRVCNVNIALRDVCHTKWFTRVLSVRRTRRGSAGCNVHSLNTVVPDRHLNHVTSRAACSSSKQGDECDLTTSEAGLRNVWHACPKLQAESYPRQVAFTISPILLFLLPDRRLYMVKNMCIYIYIHTSDTVQTVYELPLLPNNTAVKRFYTNLERYEVLTGYSSSGRRPGGDWTNTWHWAERFATFCLTGNISSPVTATFSSLLHSSRKPLLEYNIISIFFAVALPPKAGHGLLILEVSRSHTTTHRSR